jgi:hypothetical protein
MPDVRPLRYKCQNICMHLTLLCHILRTFDFKLWDFTLLLFSCIKFPACVLRGFSMNRKSHPSLGTLGGSLLFAAEWTFNCLNWIGRTFTFVTYLLKTQPIPCQTPFPSHILLFSLPHSFHCLSFLMPSVQRVLLSRSAHIPLLCTIVPSSLILILQFSTLCHLIQENFSETMCVSTLQYSICNTSNFVGITRLLSVPL